MTPIPTDSPTLAEVATHYHRHLLVFLTISGSHAYGFPSINSDLDLRGMHVTPVTDVLGIFNHRDTVEWKETRHLALAFHSHGQYTYAHPGEEVIGIESHPTLIETVTHDVAKYAHLLLKLNGNALEQLYSSYVVAMTGRGEELRDAVVPSLLSKVAANHYLGFAQHEWKAVLSRPTAKKILSVFRVLLTGISLVVTGRVHADIRETRGPFRHTLPFLDELLAITTGGVETSGYFGVIEPIERAYVTLMGMLECARDVSKLPAVPGQAAKARLTQLGRGLPRAWPSGWGTRRALTAIPEERP